MLIGHPSSSCFVSRNSSLLNVSLIASLRRPPEGGLYVCLVLLLYRGADEVSPLGPGAVVVLHVLEAKQILQHEPGVAGALADAAVGDHVLVRRHTLPVVERHELVSTLERAVLVARLAPRDALRARNVSASLARLGKPRRREDLARELRRAAHVDEHRVRSLVSGLYLGQKGADRIIRILRRVARRRPLRLRGIELASFGQP